MEGSIGNDLECSWQSQDLASLGLQLEPLVRATKDARTFLHGQAWCMSPPDMQLHMSNPGIPGSAC